MATLIKDNLPSLRIAEHKKEMYVYVDVPFGILSFHANRYYEEGWETVGMIPYPEDKDTVRFLLKRRTDY